MSKKINLADIRQVRSAASISQNAFWSQYGITQSGGSRYESGRNMPTPTKMLIWLHQTGAVNDNQLVAALKAVS